MIDEHRTLINLVIEQMDDAIDTLEEVQHPLVTEYREKFLGLLSELSEDLHQDYYNFNDEDE
jgi:hypothetical protein